MGSCGSKPNRKDNFLLQTLDDHDGGINCMAISEDGSVLVTGSEDHTARIWSLNEVYGGKCIGILEGHLDYINSILIIEHYTITASADKTIRKWDMTTCQCVFIMEGHRSLINRMILQGDFIFTSSYDRTVISWDIKTGKKIKIFSGHHRGVYPMLFIQAPDTVYYELKKMNSKFDDRDDLLLTGSADFTARSWNFVTGKCLKIFKGHEGAITCMATDSNDKILFTGSTDMTIRSWNILKGRCLKQFKGHKGSVICILVVNKIIFSGSSDHTARAWVIEYGDCTRIFRGHKRTVTSLKYHEGILFTASGDGIARAFDSKGDTIKQSFDGHELSINCMEIKNYRLFTGSHDSNINIWDISKVFDIESSNNNKSNDINNCIMEVEELTEVNNEKVIVDENKNTFQLI